ncbi:MAG: class I SAM-dependent methyltransferase [Candidatus Micrarchaeota archaeon]
MHRKAARAHGRGRDSRRSFEPMVDGFSELARAVNKFDRTASEQESRLRELLSGMSISEKTRHLYRIFAPHYDRHMAAHERSISFLLRQLLEAERIGYRMHPLLQDELLEMSCGTGTIIHQICAALPHERAKNLVVTANDISDDMKEIARSKLSCDPCAVTYTGHDLTDLNFPGGVFGTAVLSQTLHLICDEEVLKQERKENYMYIDEKRHLQAKFGVIESAFELVKMGGTMIIIDEWPPLLSKGQGPLGPGFSYLFNDGLRGVDWETFRGSIMSRVPGAQFTAQMKAPIDSRHTMHLWVFRRDISRIFGIDAPLPQSPEFAPARDEASAVLAGIFQGIDSSLIRSFAPPGGKKPWVRLLPISIEDARTYAGRLPPVAGQRNTCAIMDRCMHKFDSEERQEALKRAVDSLVLGGSLIVIDEWPAPAGFDHPISIDRLRQAHMNHLSKHLIFAGAFRVPIAEGYSSGMFGFLYRKVY